MPISTETLSRPTLGAPQARRRLEFFALPGAAPATAACLRLDEALERGCARVAEGPEGARVPERRFENGCVHPVLPRDREERAAAR